MVKAFFKKINKYNLTHTDSKVIYFSGQLTGGLQFTTTGRVSQHHEFLTRASHGSSNVEEAT